jgi:LCP family protein required for cell wall assembly
MVLKGKVFMNDSRSKQKTRKRKKLRWRSNIFLVLLILLLGGGVYLYNTYHNVAQAVSKMNKPLSGALSATQASKKLKNLEPVSILVLGDDHRSDEPDSNTDTMLVITINPKTKTTKMLSIPRDTRTKLIDKKDPSKDSVDKINAAYSYGGPEMVIDTVENFLNIPIDYFVSINFQGFEDIINAVGGIDVNNKYPFELDGVTLKAGPQHLNSHQALEYARMRHQDPRGDFGRQERQREVISLLINKGKSVSTLTNYNQILKDLSNNMTTNLTLDDMISILTSYKSAAKKMDNLEVEGQGATIGYTWYLLVDNQERQTLSDELRATLNLPPSPVTRFYKGTGIRNNFSTTRMTVRQLHEQI